MAQQARKTSQVIVAIVALGLGLVAFLFSVAIGELGLFPIGWSEWVRNQDSWGILFIFVFAIGIPIVLPMIAILVIVGSLTSQSLMYKARPLDNLFIVLLCIVTGLLIGWQTT